MLKQFAKGGATFRGIQIRGNAVALMLLCSIVVLYACVQCLNVRDATNLAAYAQNSTLYSCMHLLKWAIANAAMQRVIGL